MIRVADYIFQILEKNNVKHVFQVTGRGSLFLSDALAKNKNIESVSLHHEQSCSYAATAYADWTGGIGACLVSTGCASTNTITGVMSAWQDGIPCVFISGQNVLNETSRYTGLNLRTYGQQELDIIKLVEPITKYSTMLENPNDIVEVMNKAIFYALEGRKGPVWIDVPLDLQSSLIDPNKIFISEIVTFKEKKLVTNQISQVVNLINNSKRPAFLIGNGVRSAGAIDLFEKFVEEFKIPVTYSSSATDIYGLDNDLSIGSVGAMGCSRAGNFTVANCDLLIVLGSRLSSLTTGTEFCDFARDAKVIVVDIDKIEHSKKTIKIDLFLNSDVKQFLENLLNEKITFKSIYWLDKCIHWKNIFRNADFSKSQEIDLYEVTDLLSELMPKKSTLVTDSGTVEVILPTNMVFSKNMRCIHPYSQGAMGYALPASIGVQMISNSCTVVVVGDGSIMMNLQELESIRYLKLPIKIIIINNNVYSIIRKRQRDLFRNRTIGTDPENGVSCPNFRDVASCFGFNYLKIKYKSNMKDCLKTFFDMDGPVICEIFTRQDQAYIELALTKSSENGKLVKRPLEDQFPFLDRELFLNEMLINPIKQ